jgi:drug/metabolite transporter (DMT)-like permease
MSLPFAGELFALGAAICWAIGPLVAYFGVDKLGIFRFSMYRFALSALVLALLSFGSGQVDWSDTQALWTLALSGVIGVAFGEACLFQAVFLLGPRIASIIFSLHSPISAFVGAWIFSEELSLQAALGIMIAVMGVMIAILFRSNSEKAGGQWYKPDKFEIGLMLAAIAVIFQIVGALLSKQAISTVEPLFASFIRTASAAIAFFPIFCILRESSSRTTPHALQYVAYSAGISTVGGMTFLLAAFANTEIFRAVIISSLAPVIYIILMSIFRGDRFPTMAWIGTLMAIFGTALSLVL